MHLHSKLCFFLDSSIFLILTKICYLTLARFEASSGSADDDWSDTIPSSDSWFDNCSNASASVKCRFEDVDAGDADAENWLLDFKWGLLLPVPDGGITATIVGVEAQEFPNDETPLVDEGDTDLSKCVFDKELVPKWGKMMVEPIEELDTIDAEEADIVDDVGEPADFPM